MSKKKPRRQRVEKQIQQQTDFFHTTKFSMLAMLLICLLGAVIYSNSFGGPFVFDDINNIEENPAIRVTQLEIGQLYNAATGGRAPRPMAYLSFALNYYFGGYDVAGYHLVNLLIHLSCGILVFYCASLTYRLFLGGNHGELDTSCDGTIGWMSLFAACLFVAHPIQTQAVTYLVQRMTSMATAFYLLSLLLYIQGRLRKPGEGRWALWSGCLLSALFAISSKQIAVTLPVTILLYEWFFFQDLSKAWAVRQAKNLLGLFVLLAGVSILFLGTSPWQRIQAPYVHRDFTMMERLLTQFRVIVDYFTLILLPLPSRLNLLHNIKISHSLVDPITTLLSLLAFLAVLVGVLFYARRQRLVSFCILWIFINLALESSIIALELIYEHRLYLPMFGVALIIPYLWQRLLAKQTTIAIVLACIMIFCLGYGTYARNLAWQDRITLWTDVISKDPTFPRGYVERAHAYRLAEKFELAIPEYTKAIELDANDAATYNHRGVVYGQMGKIKLAIDDFNRAIKLQPDNPLGYTNRGHAYRRTGKLQLAIDDYTKALELRNDYLVAYNNRGAIYQHLGQHQQALSDYSKAIEIQPDYAPAYNNRGNVYADLGDLSQAIVEYSKTIELAPGFAPAYTNRGQVYQKLGQNQLAIADCLKAIEIQDDLMPAYESLAWLLSSSREASLRNGKQAIAYAKRACQLANWKSPESFDALAAAYAEEGRFPEAIKWQSKALQNAPANLVPRMRNRLKLYQANLPFRQQQPADAQLKGGK